MMIAISLGLLWVAVIVLSLTVLALARQIGVLHERVQRADLEGRYGEREHFAIVSADGRAERREGFVVENSER